MGYAIAFGIGLFIGYIIGKLRSANIVSVMSTIDIKEL